MTLREKLSDWKVWDGAMFDLGVILGMWEDGEESWFRVKGIIWSSEGDYLAHILQGLAEAGVLEYREEPDQAYRWRIKP